MRPRARKVARSKPRIIGPGLRRRGRARRQDLASVEAVLQAPGKPLDPCVRADFEPRFGYDFSRVRIHADDRAGRSANALGAEAYAVGPHLVFAPGRFAPQDHVGRALIAHELSHVVQQGSAPAAGAALNVGSTGDPTELAADRMAGDALAGRQ